MEEAEQVSIEEQSETIKRLSFILLQNFKDFLSLPGPTDGKVANLAPKLDTIAQIADNLYQTELTLKALAESLAKVKSRIGKPAPK